MVFRLARLAGATALLGLSLMLVACSSLGPGELSSLPDPDTAQYGTGAIKVGLITRDQNDDLADGAPDSAFLAAQFSADIVAKSPITLIVRRYNGSLDALKAIEDEMLKAGVQMVIGPDDDAAAQSLAGTMGRKGVLVVATGGTAAPAARLFAFGMSGSVEAALAADEMRRRNYRSIVLVSNPNGTAKVFTSVLATAVTTAGIAVTAVDGTDPAAAAKKIAALANGGTIPSAVVFVESASAAAVVMKAVRANSALAGVPAVGTSAWAFDPRGAAAMSPGWYLAPESSKIPAFAERFAKTFGQPPTPAGVLAYDLIVMAAALPQLFPGADPYRIELLTNDQGFVGAMGKFWFTADGQVHRDLYAVDLGGAGGGF
jgi:hypothetical protein